MAADLSDRSGSKWHRQRGERQSRLQAASKYASGKLVAPENIQALLEAVIRPNDRVCLEGDNQKQADFLADTLANVNKSRVHDLHVVQSGIVLQAHLDLFERGIARRLDFSYSGPQGEAIARALTAGQIELGAVHTYIELFARYFMDLTPHVALVAAEQADGAGKVGMDVYVQERSDIYFTGHDGSLRSNRMMCQNAGLYACDMFIGSTLQIDLAGNSSTFTTGRIAGFGGAPNMGSDVRGRRRPSPPWLAAGREATDHPTALTRGRKLVVQIVETFGEKMVPSFVENSTVWQWPMNLSSNSRP